MTKPTTTENPVRSRKAAAPRSVPPIVVEREHRGAPEGATGEGLRCLGGRLLALLDCQERFFEEMRLSLVEMQGTIRDESRARIQRQMDTLGEILDWCETVHADLVIEGRRAKAGDVPLDLVRVARAAAATFAEAEDAQVEVRGPTARPCWGDEASLTELLRLGIELVSRRCGGEGPITVEVGPAGPAHAVRICCLGEPLPFQASRQVERFRALAEATGARVEPDDLGPGRAGIVLRLPFLEP